MIRRLAAIVAACGLALPLAAVAGGGGRLTADTADGWFTLTSVEDRFGGSIRLRVSDDGNNALAVGFGSTMHIDTQTGASTVLPPRSTGGGRYIYITQSGRHAFGGLEAYDLETGASVDLGVGDNLDGETSLSDLTDDLSVAVAGDRLIDVATETEIDTSGANLPDADVTKLIDVSGDGTTITWEQSTQTVEGNGTTPPPEFRLDRYIRWNRVTGERAVVERPPELTDDDDDFFVDAELRWMTYRLQNGPIRRIDTATGAEVVLETDLIPDQVVLTSGDRIFFTAQPARNGANDLYAWHPGQEPRLVNRSFDGKRASEDRFRIGASRDGTVMIFTSIADNLVEGVPSRNGGMFIARFEDAAPDPNPPVPFPTWPGLENDFDVELVDYGLDDPIQRLDLASDGTDLFAITSDKVAHVDLVTGDHQILPSLGLGNVFRPDTVLRITKSGNHGFEWLPDDDTLVLLDLATLEDQRIPLVVETDFGMQDVGAVRDVTADGSIAAVSTTPTYGSRGFLIDLTTGETLTPSGLGGSISSMSDDASSLIIFSREEPGVDEEYIYLDRTTGEEIRMESPASRPPYTPWRFSRDGSTSVYVNGPDVVVRDVASGDEVVVDTPGVNSSGGFLGTPTPSGDFFFAASDPHAGRFFENIYAWFGEGSRSQLVNVIDGQRVATDYARAPDDQSFVVFISDGVAGSASYLDRDQLDLYIARYSPDQPPPSTTTTTTTTAVQPPPPPSDASITDLARATERAVRIGTD